MEPTGQPPVAPQPQPQPQPLPPQPQEQPAQPQTPAAVHVVRAVDPVKPEVSPEVQRRHERSKALHPHLNLSEGEYVIRAIRRHPIGLITPIILGILLIAITLTLMFSYSEFIDTFSIQGFLADPAIIFVLGILFIIVTVLGMAVSSYVYMSNRFYLTNESVIQEIQHSLFSRHEQTASLASIEDASFTQKGILQYLFQYGDVRLSTEGDETTYRFSYVAHPKDHVDKLNNVVEAFKNGRPVEEYR